MSQFEGVVCDAGRGWRLLRQRSSVVRRAVTCQPTRRSRATGTKMIRSTESSGSEVISTIATLSSRSSSTPPRAPAGIPSAGAVNSTRSDVAMSRTAGMSLMLEGRVGGYQAWRVACLGVVPRSGHRGRPCVQREREGDAAHDAELASVDHAEDWSVERGVSNRAPYAFGVLCDAKDACPFSSVSMIRENPSQLLGCHVGIAGAG